MKHVITIELFCLLFSKIVFGSIIERYSSDSPNPKRQCIETDEFQCTSHHVQLLTNDYPSNNPELELITLTPLENVRSNSFQQEPLLLLNYFQNIPDSNDIPLTHDFTQLLSPATETLLSQSMFNTQLYPNEFENIPCSDNGPLIDNYPQSAGPSEESLIPAQNIDPEFCPNDFGSVIVDDSPQSNYPIPEQPNSEITESPLPNPAIIDSDLQPNTFSDVPSIQNEPILSSSERNLSDIKCSHGIFSWHKSNVKHKLFNSSFKTSKLLHLVFYYGTDNYENIFLFKYAVGSFSLLASHVSFSNNEYISKSIKAISIIFDSVASLNYYSRPYYYFYIFNRKIANSTMNDCRRVPLYFFFTLISHLMKTDGSNCELFVPLIENVYKRIAIAKLFRSNKWTFLKKCLKETFGIVEGVVEKKDHTYVRFDISTVSFIYDEMSNGESEKTKQFFKQIWKACQENRYKRTLIEFNENFKLNLPIITEYNLNYFEQAARKLYQLKFTDLLFKQWNSIEELIEEFEKLKSNFDSIPVDFRLRVFSRNDFEMLKNSLEKIKLFPINRSSLNFFVELEYFITFKSFIFAYDFSCNLNPDSISYQRTFKNIKSIYKAFEEVRNKFLSKKIQLPPLNYNLIEPKINNSFSLKALISNFPIFQTNPSSTTTVMADSLIIFLNNFQYFKCNLGTFKEVSRFLCLSFIAELEELLIGNDNDDEIEKIFDNQKYKVFMEIWPKALLSTVDLLTEEKKEYLKHFKMFLFLHNQ